MSQVQMTAQATPPVAAQFMSAAFQDGTQVPPLSHREAMAMYAEEHNRFLTLIKSLSDEDWGQQTACSLWTVKDVVAHQAAHVVGLTSLRSLISQVMPPKLRPYRSKGMSILDAWNQSQVDLRSTYSPAQLIAEIGDNAEATLKGRDRLLPAVLRGITMPMPGLDQPRSPGYLFDVIFTRDMWMHRLDICNATGRKMPLDPAHDGRMVALIVRDLAEKSRRGLDGRSAVLTLTGAAGGTYRIGSDDAPTAVVEIDTLTFCILTSGREKAANLLTGGQATISGDIAFGRSVMNFCENRVLY